ncbi:unnamed protein product [Linum tenue]|uniref:DUF4371 domain-containing protein n=1 Tax=Linum tenue TaxID=586396 RepID=A0AAV0JT84_9ROSI|nr:unnamed protein product [Linum tenue]
MVIVLRFVDAKGFIQERFFDIIHVEDTTSKTLYSAIRSALSFYKFPIQNLRGQGYDGASNMRGEWNGLQELFLKDSPQAYYVHCMAHRLQLSLVAAARDVFWVHEFFTHLSSIVTAVTGSCKRQDQLEAAEASKIALQLATCEIETRKGANQKILGTTDMLCVALQRKSQDILSAIRLVESTKKLLSEVREKEWDSLLADVIAFCKKHDIEALDLSAPFFRGRSIRKRDVTNEHHYHYDVFNAAIDVQIAELESRFNDRVVELLKLSSSLVPKDGYKTRSTLLLSVSLQRSIILLIFQKRKWIH